MKNIFKILPLLLLIAVTSCKKDELPTPSEIGNNSFGCKVDGQLMLAQKNSMFESATPLDVDVIPFQDKLYLHINGTDHTKEHLPTVDIYIDFDKALQGVSYKLEEFNTSTVSAEYYHNNESNDVSRYKANNSLPGELILTKYDKAKGIASGTFFFDAVNSVGEKVKVSEGIFDVKF